MAIDNNIPTVYPTLDMSDPRVRMVYPGLPADKVRTALTGMGIEPPEKLPDSGTVWGVKVVSYK